ncbi:MAG: T9SS type A sorting domain-containing protein [Vicingaceae bacterium]
MPISIFITNFKGMILKRILLLFFLLAAGVINAQSTRIVQFNVDLVDGNKVLVRWTMNAGSTCRTLEVERSMDRDNFKSVYEYPGICGDEANEETYTWLDDKKDLNGMLYYRVRLEEGEYTLVDSVLVKNRSTEKLLSVSPNPSSAVFQINIQKNQTETYKWELFSPNGLLLQQQQNQSDSQFRVDLAGLNSGVYILKVLLESGIEEETYLSLTK